MTRCVIQFSFFICSIIALVKIESAEIIYLIPFPGFETNERLFDLTARDQCCKPFFDLREAISKIGYKLQLSNIANVPADGKLVIVFDVRTETELKQLTQKYQKDKLILMIWEPLTVNPENYNLALHEYFGKILTTDDALVDSERYFKFYYPQPSLCMIDDIVPFEHKKLCTMIAYNKYSKHPLELYSMRLEAINFFEKNFPNDFDFYGMGWQNSYKTYKGTIANKKKCLKNYKFCVCYENTRNLEGYITEKIFDCFVAGCVPIYWGSKTISQYIPQECFIDKTMFSSYYELYQFIQSISPDKYEEYLSHIKKFLEDKKARYFSTQYFIENIISILGPILQYS